MLKIKDMNLNNVIRQGDSQPREYQLDTGNLNLNLANKQATIRLMTDDYKGIAYETTATVSSENKISFSIDDVIPAREYRLEITVDDYVFPSRATDGRFDIDPSSHGQEVNIIQIIGKDEIVREVKEQIDSELEPFLGEIEQAELDRQAQEEAREATNKSAKDYLDEFPNIKDALKFPADNLVPNGDFSQGTVGWRTPSTDFSVVNGVGRFWVSVDTGRIFQGINRDEGDVIYRSALVQTTSDKVGLGETIIIRKAHSGSNQYEHLSYVSGVGDPYISVVDRRTSGFDRVYVKNVLALNLTKLFGKGNEPSVDEVDELLARFDDFWFSETDNFFSLRDIYDLFTQKFKVIRETGGIGGNVGFVKNPYREEWTGQAMVTLSYDDGQMNNYYLALPIHEKYGVPATFNIITSSFDDPTFFDEDIVKETYERGFEIASHSHSHGEVFTNLTDEELHFEASESIRLLNQAIGRQAVETIAIPYSLYDERVKNIISQYFKGARVFGAMNNEMPPSDRYNIHSRIALTSTTTFSEVKPAIDEAVAQKKWCVLMMHDMDNRPDGERSHYGVTQRLLDEILAYINSIGRDKLLPINTKDALKFTLGDDY